MTDNDSHEPPERRFWRIWRQAQRRDDAADADDAPFDHYAAATRHVLELRTQRKQAEVTLSNTHKENEP